MTFLTATTRRAHGFVASALRSASVRRLAEGAAWSIAGVIIARALSLGAAVLVARALGQHSFGQLGVVTGTVTTFQAFTGFALGTTATKYVAELRATDPDRAGRIIGLSARVGGVVGVVSTLGMLLGAPLLASHVLAAPELVTPLRLGALMLFFGCVNGAQAGALAGFQEFRAMTLAGAIASIINVPIAVAGATVWGLGGAVASSVSAMALQCAFNHYLLRRCANEHCVPLSRSGTWAEARVLWTFSLPALLASLVVAPAQWACSAIIVNQPMGYEEMGAFSAANQWHGALLFVPGVLGQVLLPELSRRMATATATPRRLLRYSIGINAACVTPPAIVIALLSTPLMSMYGHGFADAGPTMVVSLLTAVLIAIQSPVGPFLSAAERMWAGVVMNVACAAICIALTMAFKQYGAMGLATARLAAYTAQCFWAVAYAWRISARMDISRPPCVAPAG